jgi:hypothetical protein
MGDKQAVREELFAIKQTYSRFKTISTTFPYEFAVDYEQQEDLNVDFDGLKIFFAVPELYPQEAPKIIKVEASTNGRPIPKILLDRVAETLNSYISKQFKPGSIVMNKTMTYLAHNIKTIITSVPKCLQPYIVDEFDGSSKRRIAFIADIPIVIETKAESSSEEDDSDAESDSSDDTGPTLYSLKVPPPSLSSHGPNDVCLTFEGVDLKNISVFECTELNLVAHCSRCQHPADVKNLTPNEDFMHECTNCTRQLEMHFYPHAIMSVSLTQQNIFAQVECSGCTLFDTLPTCKFAALCFECSNVNDIGSIRLRAANDVECQHCHKTLSLVVQKLGKVPTKDLAPEEETKTGGTGGQQVIRKKKKPSALTGITVGLPLPEFGTCKHYRHSQRWLRFPCCGKAYPCDICHEDECTQNNGDQVWANRMICGHCSTEQQVSATCKACLKPLTKRRKPGEAGVAKLGRSEAKKRGVHKITKSKRGHKRQTR